MDRARDASRGSVVTFYSYKGGTGRTMALANTACVLTEFERAHGGAVLIVDWDLEAPGLHRFFPPRLRTPDGVPGLGLDDQAGLIDLMIELREHLPAELPSSAEAAEEAAAAALDAVRLERFIAPTEVPGVNLMRAGRDDDGGYGKRVATFDWEGLFARAPTIYRALAERLAGSFRWVLVDSRTGVTDISGICTTLLPDKVVVVFTPNRQSLSGVRELVQRAVAYRSGSDDLRPLLVYPLPSRIEASLERLSRHWRYGNPESGIVGYQPMFTDLLTQCYGLASCDLQDYLDAVQIQQTPDAAYGELIAVRQGSADRLSLASSYRVFVKRLTSGRAPWEAKEAPQAAAAPSTSSTSAPLAPAPSKTDFDPFSFDEPPAASAPGTGKPDILLDDLFGASSPAASDSFAELGSDRTAPRPPPPTPTPPRAPTVFASHAAADAPTVTPLLKALEGEGFRVRSSTDAVRPGESYTTSITRSIDASDVVVVFWSRASVESRAIEAEVLEGMRRGVLVPVLLDDALPPLGMRHILAVDLNRGGAGGVDQLVDAVRRIAARKPGDAIAPPAYDPDPFGAMPPALSRPPSASAPETSPAGFRPPASLPSTVDSPPRGARSSFALGSVAAALVLGTLAVVAWWALKAEAPHTTSVDPSASTPVSSSRVTVPEVIDLASDVAEAAVKAAGLAVVLQDSVSGATSRTLDGIVVGQSPQARTLAAPGSTVRLSIATKTVEVPLLIGAQLSEVLTRLRANGLEVGRVESVANSSAPSGTVVAQDPPLGQRVAAGVRVNVSVAGAPTRSLPSNASK